MSATDSPSVNLRKALKKLGPVQVNVAEALKGLRVMADGGPFPQHGAPDTATLGAASDRCWAIVRRIVALKEDLIREYEALGGTWDRPSS